MEAGVLVLDVYPGASVFLALPLGLFINSSTILALSSFY
jgi:hypothetical protein